MIFSSFGEDLVRAKAELLCFGIRINKRALPILLDNYPLLLREKYIHAAHLVLEEDILVNVCISEQFARLSPYELTLLKDELLLTKNGKPQSLCRIIIAPKWYFKKTSSGTRMASIFRQHGFDTLYDATFVGCDYFKMNKKCLFCSFPKQMMDPRRKIVQVSETVAETLKENYNYSVALSEGAKRRPDRGWLYLSEVVKRVKQVKSDIPISVEIVPPEENEFIDLLIHSGASSIIINLELFDDDLRRLFCPEKGKIGGQKYFEVLRYSVERLGPGNVSSVLIAGLEKKEFTIKGALEMIELGVIPTIIPFRPYDNCFLRNFPVTDPNGLVVINSVVGNLLKRAGLNPKKQKGCTACGACSVEFEYGWLVKR